MKLYGMCQDWQRKKRKGLQCERPVLGKSGKWTALSNTSEKLIMSEEKFASLANEQR